MTRISKDIRTILTILGAVAISALLIVAVLSGNTETIHQVPDTEPDIGDGPPDLSSAVIVATAKSEGPSLFGLHFGDATYTVGVRLFAPAGCAELIGGGDKWPVAAAECSSPVPIAGEITGKGRVATGETLVRLDVEVTEDCYDGVRPGDPWPPDHADCTMGGS